MNTKSNILKSTALVVLLATYGFAVYFLLIDDNNESEYQDVVDTPTVEPAFFLQKQIVLNQDVFDWRSLVHRNPAPLNFWSALALYDFDDDEKQELAFLGYSDTDSVSYFIDPTAEVSRDVEIVGADAKGLGRGMLFTHLVGDERDDLVVVTNDPYILSTQQNQEQGGIYIFEQTTQGVFERVLYIPINHVVSPVGYDFDRDGDTDILFSRYNPIPVQARMGWYLDKLFVLENRDGSFSSELIFLSQDLDWDSNKEPWAGPPIHSELCDYPAGDTLMKKAHDFAITVGDVNHDGYLDIIVAADFRKSYILRGTVDGFFEFDHDSVFEDCNAMGSVVADFDQDGDLDWFTTNIFNSKEHHTSNPSYNAGISGNQMHVNNGEGVFSPHSVGVENGAWAWGACAADFNRDGFVDIAHVTGAGIERLRQTRHFQSSPMRLFLSLAGREFIEQAQTSGLGHFDEERAIVCHDFDQDGDIDIASLSIEGVLTYSENQGRDDNNYLSLDIVGPADNRTAVGYRVYVETSLGVQYQQIQSSDHYNSKGPRELFFGLGQAAEAVVSAVSPQGVEVYREQLLINHASTIHISE